MTRRRQPCRVRVVLEWELRDENAPNVASLDELREKLADDWLWLGFVDLPSRFQLLGDNTERVEVEAIDDE